MEGERGGVRKKGEGGREGERKETEVRREKGERD